MIYEMYYLLEILREFGFEEPTKSCSQLNSKYASMLKDTWKQKLVYLKILFILFIKQCNIRVN